MEKIILDSAIKFGAGRYRQEEHLLEQCGEEIARFSKKAFLLAGNTAFSVTKDRLLPGIEAAGVDYTIELYQGPCSYEAAAELGKKALHLGCAVK